MDSTAVTNSVKSWPQAVKDYVQDLQMEMRRVTWPSRKQVQATTTVVIVTVFGFAAFFFAVDALFGRAINWVFNAFMK